MGQSGTPPAVSILMPKSAADRMVTEASNNAIVSESQEIENNFLKYNKLAPWKEVDRS